MLGGRRVGRRRAETGAEGDKSGFCHAAFLPPHLSFPCELATTSAPYGKHRRVHLFPDRLRRDVSVLWFIKHSPSVSHGTADPFVRRDMSSRSSVSVPAPRGRPEPFLIGPSLVPLTRRRFQVRAEGAAAPDRGVGGSGGRLHRLPRRHLHHLQQVTAPFPIFSFAAFQRKDCADIETRRSQIRFVA